MSPIFGKCFFLSKRKRFPVSKCKSESDFYSSMSSWFTFIFPLIFISIFYEGSHFSKNHTFSSNTRTGDNFLLTCMRSEFFSYKKKVSEAFIPIPRMFSVTKLLKKKKKSFSQSWAQKNKTDFPFRDNIYFNHKN